MGSFEIPKLSFGFMRLPRKDDKIDYTELNQMVDEAMENGVNYFDTSHLYMDGNSEKALKKAVVDRYPRDSFMIASKVAAWDANSREKMKKVFDEQLERLGVEYIDFYLLQSLEESHMKLYLDEGLDYWGWGQELKSKGLIRHFGFSFHDTPERLDEILTAHPEVEFVQLQLNYLDWDNLIVQAGKCYEVARRHNKPIIIMEPVKGGMLASMTPNLEARMKAVNPNRSIASWAIRFCLSLEGVASVLSGMSSLEQLRDNINTLKNYTPFTEDEKACLDYVTKELLAAPTVACTSCRYCISGCPSNINIADVIAAYNTILTYGDHERPHFFYRGLLLSTGAASSCIKCKKCEIVCPQHLGVIEILEKASAMFDER